MNERQSAFRICNVAAPSPAARRTCKFSPPETAPATSSWEGHRPALLKLTSGTTAAPRAVRFRSEQLLADCENICETMGISERDLNFGVIPNFAFLWLQQFADAAHRARRFACAQQRSDAARHPRRPRRDWRDRLSRHAGFLPVVLRNLTDGPLFTRFAALQFPPDPLAPETAQAFC